MLVELNHIDINIAGSQLLSDVCFHASEGEFVYLTGPVGAGKSSLLKVLYGELPLPEGGEARILDFDLYQLKRKHVPLLRKNLGIVFQDFRLLSDRSVMGNLDFVLRATGWRKKNLREQRIAEVLEEVGLSDKADLYPHQLSGGEQQRVAVARALLNTPRVILADEPTGNLDSENGMKIVSLLRSACERGTAVIMVTHNLNILQRYPGIVYHCEGGRLQEITNECNAPITVDR